MSVTMESLRIKADRSEQERLRLWVMNGDLKLKLDASNKLVAELKQKLLDSNEVNETLKLKLDAASKLEGELNQRLLDTNKVNETLHKENLMAVNRIQEEERIMEDLNEKYDRLKEMKSKFWVENGALKLQLKAVKKKASDLEQQLEAAKLSQAAGAKREENSSWGKAEHNTQLPELMNITEEETAELSNHMNVTDEESSEFFTLMNKLEYFGNGRSAQSKGLEANVSELKLELASLSDRKREFEKQIESRTSEAKMLEGENLRLQLLRNELQNRVADLERIIEEKNDELSAVVNKFEDDKNSALSQMKDLTTKLNALQLELDGLRAKGQSLEEQVENEAEEAQRLKDENMALQENMTKMKLDALLKVLKVECLDIPKCDLVSEIANWERQLESQIEKRRQEVSDYQMQVEILNCELKRKIEDEKTMLEKQEDLTQVVKNMKLEMENVHYRKHLLELQIEKRDQQAEEYQNQMEHLNKELTVKIKDQQEILKEKEKSAALINELELELDSVHLQKNQLEMHVERRNQEAMEHEVQLETVNTELARKISELVRIKEEKESLKMVVNKLQLEVNLFCAEKTGLELQIEKQKRSASERHTHVENQNHELTRKIADQENMLKEKEGEFGVLQQEVKTIKHEFGLLLYEYEHEKQYASERDALVEKLNLELTTKISDQESMLKEKEGEIGMLQQDVTTLEHKLGLLNFQLGYFEQEKQNASQKQTQLENLNLELKSKNSDQERTMQEKVGEIEVLQQEVITLKQKLGLLNFKLGESEQEMQYASERQIEVENLNLELTSKIADLETMLKDKEGEIRVLLADQETLLKEKEGEIGMLQQDVNTLEHELGSLKIQLDDSVQEKQHASKRQIEVENLNLELTSKIVDLEIMLKEKEGEVGVLLSDQEIMLEEKEGEIGVLQEEVKALEHKLRLLNSQLLDFEQGKQHATERQTEVENLNLELASKLADQEQMLKEKEGQIGALKQDVKTLEHKLGLLHFQLDESEQLFTMMEESNLLIAEKFQQDCIAFENQICQITEQIASIKETRLKTINAKSEGVLAFENLKVEDYGCVQKCFLGLFDDGEKQELEEKTDNNAIEKITDKKQEEIVSASSEKVLDVKHCEEEDNEYFQILNLCDELEKQELEKMKGNVVEEPTDDKEEIASSSSSIIGEELEGKVVAMLEKRVKELEKKIKEKDEAMVSLEEEKREAIRQLCVQIDYQRGYCDHLKELLLMKSKGT